MQTVSGRSSKLWIPAKKKTCSPAFKSRILHILHTIYGPQRACAVLHIIFPVHMHCALVYNVCLYTGSYDA